jgi:hypothetical protein
MSYIQKQVAISEFRECSLTKLKSSTISYYIVTIFINFSWFKITKFTYLFILYIFLSIKVDLILILFEETTF